MRYPTLLSFWVAAALSGCVTHRPAANSRPPAPVDQLRPRPIPAADLQLIKAKLAESAAAVAEMSARMQSAERPGMAAN